MDALHTPLRHSPGPWRRTGFGQVFSQRNFLVAAVFFGEDLREGHGNAVLVAAAPYLLDGCRLAIDSMRDTLDGNNPAWMDNMRADLAFIETAVAKARGL